MDEESLLKVLEERGIVDDVMKTLDLSATESRSPERTKDIGLNSGHVTPHKARPHPRPHLSTLHPPPQVEGN